MFWSILQFIFEKYSGIFNLKTYIILTFLSNLS